MKEDIYHIYEKFEIVWVKEFVNIFFIYIERLFGRQLNPTLSVGIKRWKDKVIL